MGKNHRREVDKSSSQNVLQWRRESKKKKACGKIGEEALFIRGSKMEPLGQKKQAAGNPAWGQPAPVQAGKQPKHRRKTGSRQRRQSGLDPALGRPGSELGREGTRAGRPAPGLGRQGSTRVGRDIARACRPRTGLGPARPGRHPFFFLFLIDFSV